MKHEQFGKCGPGGAPWRNPRQIGHSFMKSMGWTDKTLLQTLDPINNQKLMTPPDELDESPFYKSSQADRKRNDTSNQLRLPAQCCANCFCECKAKYLTPPLALEKENANLSTTRTREESANRLCDHTNGVRCVKKCKYVKPRTCMITGGKCSELFALRKELFPSRCGCRCRRRTCTFAGEKTGNATTN